MTQTTCPKWNYLRIVLKLIGKSILWTSALLGIVSGYVALIPRVTVSQHQPLDLSKPFSTPFVVANDGPLAIRDVRFWCEPL